MFIVFSIFLICFEQIFGYKYLLTVKDGYWPCIGKEDQFIEKILDLSDFAIEADDDNNIILNGTFTFLVQIQNPMKFRIECSKKTRGEWKKVPMTMNIDDFCPIEYRSTEVWYEVTKLFVGKEKDCPPKKDFKSSFHQAKVGGVYEYPIGGAEGEYRMETSLYYNKQWYCGRIECFADRV